MLSGGKVQQGEGGLVGGGGSSRGRGLREGGEGEGTFHLPCHILHYHMVLRPKGTSHNNGFNGLKFVFCVQKCLRSQNVRTEYFQMLCKKKEDTFTMFRLACLLFCAPG